MKFNRREILTGALGVAAIPEERLNSRPLPNSQDSVPEFQGSQPSRADTTGQLARYMAAARDRDLPPPVVIAAKHRILDTFSAMVSGAKLKPGEMAITDSACLA